MDAANPFAQPPASPEPIIAQVSRQLRAEAQTEWAATESLVDGVVDRVVRGLWSSRVKTFVPILALRESRDLLREERQAASSPFAAAALHESSAVPESGAASREPVAHGHDRLAHKRGDVLHVDRDRLGI